LAIIKAQKGYNTMKITKAYAKEVLNLWKYKTGYFDGSITEAQFENMLIYRFGFGQAEAIVITMALILAGAKFAN
jgi:hypothetical protein